MYSEETQERLKDAIVDELEFRHAVRFKNEPKFKMESFDFARETGALLVGAFASWAGVSKMEFLHPVDAASFRLAEKRARLENELAELRHENQEGDYPGEHDSEIGDLEWGLAKLPEPKMRKITITADLVFPHADGKGYGLPTVNLNKSEEII